MCIASYNKMTTRSNESLAIEIYKDILDSYTIMQTSQTLGLSQQEFIKMLSSDRVEALDSLVNSSFQNYWGQMSPEDREAFIEKNKRYLDERGGG